MPAENSFGTALEPCASTDKLSRAVSFAAQRIYALREKAARSRAILVGISGIDGSGKGFVAARLAEELDKLRIRSAIINVDRWLNLPNVRFDHARPAPHFYENALRLDEMFETSVLPLRDSRSIQTTVALVTETATEFHQHEYAFNAIDVILLEGIFIYKQEFNRHFDLKIWLDCSFETALDRALARSQEGLGRSETVEAYKTTYFPAQQLHFRLDRPKASADLVITNDDRLSHLLFNRRL
jgi:uridine kinase